MVPITPVTDLSGNVILDGQVDTADIICVSKARLGDMITTLCAAQMKDIDKSIAISLDLLHYYTHESDKYHKLNQYAAQVKADRNQAQDTLQQIKDAIWQHGFDSNGQQKIMALLDMQ